MAVTINLLRRHDTAEEQALLEQLSNVLAGLPAPWSVIANERPQQPPWVRYVVLHPDKGMALLDVASSRPEGQVSRVASLFTRAGFGAFEQGSLPLIAITIGKFQIEALEFCLDTAFQAVRCGLTVADWPEQAISLLLERPDMNLKRLGRTDPISRAPTAEVTTPPVSQTSAAEVTTPPVPQAAAATITAPLDPEALGAEVATPPVPQAPAAEAVPPPVAQAAAAEITAPPDPEAHVAAVKAPPVPPTPAAEVTASAVSKVPTTEVPAPRAAPTPASKVTTAPLVQASATEITTPPVSRAPAAKAATPPVPPTPAVEVTAPRASQVHAAEVATPPVATGVPEPAIVETAPVRRIRRKLVPESHSSRAQQVRSEPPTLSLRAEPRRSTRAHYSLRPAHYNLRPATPRRRIRLPAAIAVGAAVAAYAYFAMPLLAPKNTPTVATQPRSTSQVAVAPSAVPPQSNTVVPEKNKAVEEVAKLPPVPAETGPNANPGISAQTDTAPSSAKPSVPPVWIAPVKPPVWQMPFKKPRSPQPSPALNVPPPQNTQSEGMATTPAPPSPPPSKPHIQRDTARIQNDPSQASGEELVVINGVTYVNGRQPHPLGTVAMPADGADASSSGDSEWRTWTGPDVPTQP